MSINGNHDDAPEILNAHSKINYYERPTLIKQEKLLGETMMYNFVYKKACLYYTLFEDKNGKLSFHFFSVIGSLKKNEWSYNTITMSMDWITVAIFYLSAVIEIDFCK